MQRIFDLDSLIAERWPPPEPDMWTALIPAAGKGSRLDYHLPKILYPILDRTILDWIIDLLLPFCSRFVFVLSPENERTIQPVLKRRLADRFAIVTQPDPTGMADAVALCRPAVTTPHCLLLWGDQLTVRASTIDRCMRLHASRSGAALTLPTLIKSHPYVRILRDTEGRFTEVIQGREQDVVAGEGENDCGLFLFRSQTLFEILNRNRQNTAHIGKKTRERNLLPLLPQFEGAPGSVATVRLSDAAETLGVNTAEDAREVENVLRARSVR